MPSKSDVQGVLTDLGAQVIPGYLVYVVVSPLGDSVALVLVVE